MVVEIKIWDLLFALLVLSNMQLHVHGDPQVPCYFIFGDSLADNGNNNLLPTESKADYSPYGVDFPNGPTGRFCNGRTTFDLIAELLGFENYIPPFATANDSDILQGVNYASGSAGIRDETGKNLGARISMNGQLKHHQVTVSRIVNILGSNDSATKYLEKCLYSVGMGNNDYINNYFLPEIYTTSSLYTPAQYATVLIKEYFHQIKALYNYGARKVALFGIGLIGCTPNAISLYGTDGSVCVNKMNLAASLFNNKLISLVRHLNTNLTDATFIYVDSYGIGSTNVTDLGMNVTNIGCCPVTEDGLCSPSETPCQNRSEYAFWDSFHPTEALNKVTSSRSYHAVLPTDTYPIDISHLATSALIMEPNWQGSYTTNKELMES